MPLTLSSSNIIVTYGSEDITYDTVKSNTTLIEYVVDPIIKQFEGVDVLNGEEQFPRNVPSGLPSSSADGSQNFDFNLSAVIDSNGYSTYMNYPPVATYQTKDTTVGFSQSIDGYMYEFRTNNSGATNGKFYEVLDNNKGNNWYITYYEFMSGTIYNQYGYNNHDVTYLSDGTTYRGIWLEIGGRENMVLKKYSWSMADSSTYRSQRRPVIWLVCGSNDRKVWTPIHNVPDQIVVPDTINSTPNDQTDIYFTMFDEPAPYKYFRWIVRKLNTDTWFAISTFKLYGYEYIEPPIIKVDPSDSDYKYIVFRNRGNSQTIYNITFPENTTCDLLVVGGGGAGGNFGSGAGAGDVLYFTNVSMSSGTYVIKVGKGGVTGRSDTNVAYIAGYSGENSSIQGGTIDITAGGGGGGAGWNTAPLSGTQVNYINPITGGTETSSGGGAGSAKSGQSPASGNGVSGNGAQGDNDGWNNSTSPDDGSGGGGGGASPSGHGGLPVGEIGGAGGAGIYVNITGENIEYGKGGAGAGYETPYTVNPPSDIGQGGPGGNDISVKAYPRNGGSGVVIIRYKTIKNTETKGAQWTYENSGNVFNIGNVGIGTEAHNDHALNIKGDFNYDGNLYKNNMLISQGKKYKIKSDIEINKPNAYFKYTPERMYPPTRNLASANHLVTGESYGNGVYETSDSSNSYTYPAYAAFNGSGGVGYHNTNSNYSGRTYTGSEYIVSGYLGDWIKIKLPVDINLTKYGFKQRGGSYEARAPGSYKIYGSNDDTNWYELVERSYIDITYSQAITESNDYFEENITTTNTYKYFALVVNKVYGGGTVPLNFDEWYIFGREIDYTYNQVENSYIYDAQLSREYTVLDSDATNLVLWYKFDGNDGDNNLLDSNPTSTKYNLINGGDITFGYDGYIGESAIFNGGPQTGNGYLQIDSSFNLYDTWNGNGITLSVWFKYKTGTANYSRIFNFSVNDSPSNQFGISKNDQNNNGSLFFFMFHNGTEYRSTSNNNVYTFDKWHHIAWSISAAGEWNVYIDNVRQNFTRTNGIPNVVFNKNYFGKSMYTSNNMLTGNIGDFRIYNKELSEAEIDALANNKVKVLASAPPGSLIFPLTVYKKQYVSVDSTYPVLECDKNNLLAWYKLNGNNKDSSENGLHLINKEAGLLYDQNTYHPLYKTVLLSTSDTSKHWALTPNINQDVPLTITFWFRALGSASYTIMGYGNYPNPSIQFDYSSNGLAVNTALNNQWTTTPTHSSILEGEWYHVTYTLSDSNPVMATLYINGEFSIERYGNNNATLLTSTNLTIANSGDNGRGYRGNIADVRIYNKVLTRDEISIIYNGKVKNANYYKTITFKYNYINDMQSRAERITGVNGWVMVKYKPVSSYWYKGNDNLQGNFVMNGASRLDDEEWSIAWDDNHYNQVLFVKGDFVSWLHVNASSLDLTGWQSPAALGGNKLTNGNFRYYRDASDSDTSTWATSPYIFDHDVDYTNAYGDMVYQEFSDYGYGGIPGVTWDSTTDYLKYAPEQYKYYVFVRRSTDIASNTPNYTEYSLKVPEATVCDILLVGGGGGGGKWGAGGGGGDVQYFSDVTLEASDYTIRVGNGGKGSTTYGGLNQNATNGINTELFIDSNSTALYIAAGGGGGTSWDGGDTGGIDPMTDYSAVNNNSSGGGGGGSTTHVYSQGGNSIVSTYSGDGGAGGDLGDNIGTGDRCVASGGGGGGGPNGVNGQNAYMDGTSNTDSKSGNGGDGTTSAITGVSVYYGGGGGGGGKGGSATLDSIVRNVVADGLGGRGGGGNGNETQYKNFGLANTGGGGGGGSANGGGAGGSGIVIIRYKATLEDPSYVIKEWTYSNSAPLVYHKGNVGIGNTVPQYSLDIYGTMSAISKNFKIEHPTGKKKWLYHASVEGPRYDNIYRGKKIIKNGMVHLRIDEDCNDIGGMKRGTFAKLNGNPQLFLQNNHTYDAIKGSIKDGIITITCENDTDEIEVDWLVVAERKDEAVIKSSLTNSKGNLICEQNINKSKTGMIGTTVHVKNNTITGLFWEYIGDEVPERGVPFKNDDLSLALQEKQEFTEDEWIQFNIRYLRDDNYILSGTKYYKPLAINNDIELI
jgi:hypothetical protein